VVAIAVGQEDSVRRRNVLAGLVGLVGTSVLPNPAAHAADSQNQHTVSALRQRLAKARADFDECRYGRVATVVPEVVLACHRMVDATDAGRERDRYIAVLADGYSLASFLADKLGDYSLSWIMADRARGHALASGNPSALRPRPGKPPSRCVAPTTTTTPHPC